MKFGKYEVPDNWTVKEFADYFEKIGKLNELKHVFNKRKTAQEILDTLKER